MPLDLGNEGVWKEQVSEQVERIVRSSVFQGSETLRQLLAYLAKRAIENPAEPAKAREIAAAVFGRSEDFNPQTDSIVRVQTGRLRAKLAEYYVTSGAEDPVFINIPKGSYALAVSQKEVSTVVVEAHEPLEPLPPEPALPPPRWAPDWRVILVALLAIAGVATAATMVLKRAEQRRLPEALAAFWKPFSGGGEAPLVVFSNFSLVGSFQEGLRDSKSAGQTSGPVIDTYTSVGEVMGVFEVTRILSQFGTEARAKRGALLTWDEAKDSDLIFVGGPLAATPLRDLPFFREFAFRNGGGQPGEIANLRPRRGEQNTYRGPATRPFGFDYAVIAMRPSANPAHRTLALAGITEFGTQAAAEFVTREENIRELLRRLDVRPNQPVPPFEAVIRTTITADVPIRSDLVAVHPAR